MLALDEAEQLLPRTDLFVDAVANVRTIEAGDEFAGVLQVKSLYDLFPRQRIRSGSECNPRYSGESLGKNGESDVLRSEVVTPLRYSVSFIDCEER